jgi:hypothetical protein
MKRNIAIIQLRSVWIAPEQSTHCSGAEMTHLRFLLSFLIGCFLSGYCQAQLRENPLKDSKWLTLSGGANTADHISWQSGVSYSFRGETLLTQMRLMYSQELIEGADDSVFVYKNRLAEYGIMWGDGWGGRNWYVSGSIGMGINLRMYGDSALQNEGTFRYLTALTIGVPAQAELGAWLSPSLGVNLMLLGNWNFRQPYLGVHAGMLYRFKKGKSK